MTKITKICFYICLCIYFYRELYIFKWINVAVYHPFISTWKIPFSVSCRAGLVVRNSFSFCFSGKNLNFFIFELQFFLDTIFLDYRFCDVVVVVVVQHYDYIILLPLAFKVSAEKSTSNCIDTPLYVTSCLCLAAFESLFLSVTLYSSIMCLGMVLLGLFSLKFLFVFDFDFLAAWIYMTISFLKFGKCSTIIFFE